MARTCIALLRGINVGKAKRVAMVDLKRVVESLGFGNVRTLLNSGNVVFDMPTRSRTEPGARIQAAIETELGVACKVIVLTAEELSAVMTHNPLAEMATDASRMMVMVIANTADHAHVEAVATEDWSPEAIAAGPRVAYLWCANGILDSRVSTALGKRIKDGMTARNWTTMQKLEAMARASSV